MNIRGEVLVILDNNLSDDYMDIESYSDDDNFYIYINTRSNRKFLDLICDKQLLFEMIYHFISEKKEEKQDNNKVYDYVDKHFSEIFEFLQNTEEIYVSGCLADFKEFLGNNNFKNKKIIWTSRHPLKIEIVDLLKTNFKNFDNLYFIVEGNSHYVDIEMFEKTVNYIDRIVEHVKKLNLSPLEETMYVYDFVRNREYKEENPDEEHYVSRDLTSVIFGDKIVCVGFSILFNSILKKLGHNIISFRLDALIDYIGHNRSLEYINDKKYDVEGLFFSDVTFGCKKNNDNSFLDSYKYFAKTFKRFKAYDKGALMCKTYEYFEDNSIDQVESELNKSASIINLISIINLSNINKMLELIDEEPIDFYVKEGTSEELIEKMFLISMLASRSINSEVFLKVLYNVRRRQYYENPQIYSFDVEKMISILSKSNVADSEVDSLTKIIFYLEGKEILVGVENAKERVEKFFQEEDRELDMARIKLTRTLKNISENGTMKK